MNDHIDNRIEFDAQTAAAGAVMDWLDGDEYRAFIGCTPAMVAQVAVNAYRRSREQACAITTVEQLDALPDEAIVRSNSGVSWHKSSRYDPTEPWWCTGSEIESPSEDVRLPALLIWHPDWATS